MQLELEASYWLRFKVVVCHITCLGAPALVCVAMAITNIFIAFACSYSGNILLRVVWLSDCRLARGYGQVLSPLLVIQYSGYIEQGIASAGPFWKV